MGRIPELGTMLVTTQDFQVANESRKKM